VATLEARLRDLASTVAAKFNAIKAALAPAGGTTGQVLTKSSNTDYAYGWVTPASAPPAFASVEINLGYPARRAGTFQISGLAGLTIGKPVQIWLARGPYTGKGTAAGEEGMYAGQITGAVTAADTISASFAFSSRIGGVIKFNYLIGA